MRYVNVLLAFVAPFTVAPVETARAGDTPAPPGYAILKDDFSRLREDFNRAKGSVRLLFVVDPICPGCLRGMDDMNKDLLSRTKDERLQTFVVHVPVIGAKAKDVAPAARLLENPHVRDYWNASGDFGRALAKAVRLKNDKETVYAWDVWLLYYFFDCKGCGVLLRPKHGDCCVFCSYGTHKCPPMQVAGGCCAPA